MAVSNIIMTHLVASTHDGLAPFTDPELAWRMWFALRRTWPDAMAVCLMPNHLHVSVALPGAEPQHIDREVRRLRMLLHATNRSFGPVRMWRPVPAPDLIIEPVRQLRAIRYAHQNPSTARLCDDPLEWPWSTYRGVVGAETNPLVPASRLAAAFRRRRNEAAAWWHRYTAGTADLPDSARRRPAPAPPQRMACVPLATIWHAALSATVTSRTGRDARRAFVHLAHHQGWRDNAVLADSLGVSIRTVQRMAKRASSHHLAAAALCLGDGRLRIHAQTLAALDRVRASWSDGRTHRTDCADRTDRTDRVVAEGDGFSGSSGVVRGQLSR